MYIYVYVFSPARLARISGPSPVFVFNLDFSDLGFCGRRDSFSINLKEYSLWHLKCHSNSFSKFNAFGLFPTERGKRDVKK